MHIDPTERFSDRAAAYHTFRPRYPRELIGRLTDECDLTSSSVIADVGAGTGILTELFLENGNIVHAVEPNAPMRSVAEHNFSTNPRFHSVAAPAEATMLPDTSVDIIVAGQAFHWFDRVKAKAEFARILRRNGWIVLVWNERAPDTSPFAVAFEAILKEHSVDYAAIDPKRTSRDTQSIGEFLGRGMRMISIRHQTRLTQEQVIGLLASASYAPLPGHPKHAAMIDAVREAFSAHQVQGTVPFDYEMKAYCGPRFAL